MAVHKTWLKSREEVAERTMAFHLEKPAGFQFQPGQFVDLTLLNPPEMDSEGATRTFSIASSPYEDEVLLATRMRDSAFKRVLKNLPLGQELKLEGPMGSLTLHKNTAKPAVFLAGGIGITPFLSILRQAARDKSPHRLYLFYSNRRPEDAAFLESLRGLERTNPDFHFIPTMTAMEQSKREWKGETGVINRDMLLKYLKDLRGPIYYIAGPPGMVAGVRQMLIEAGADQDDIRAEEFGGY